MPARSLQFLMRAVSIVISTILLIISLVPAIKVAVCEDNGKIMSVSIQELVDHGDKHGKTVYWLLWSSIILNFARLASHAAIFRANKACAMFVIADSAASIVICASISTAIITTLYRIIKGSDCEFKDGASPFLGLLVASSGTLLSTTTFDLFTLISTESSAYQELALHQQQDDDSKTTTAIAMTDCGDCTSNPLANDMERTEIDSLNEELEMAMYEAGEGGESAEGGESTEGGNVL